MGIFKDVTLSFKGEEYTVPADQMMRLIAKVEDCITLQELTQEKGHKLNQLALAYTVALKHAGAKVEQDEVYASLFNHENGNAVVAAVTGLLMILLPPDTYRPAETEKKLEEAEEQPSLPLD